MYDARISALEKEVLRLNAEIRGMCEAVKDQSNTQTQQIVRVWRWITHFAYQVDPKYAATKKQIDQIFDATPSPPKLEEPT
jgi:hypothetical protein